MSDLNVQTLADFGQLRTAPTLTTDQRRVLAEELVTAMGVFRLVHRGRDGSLQ